MLSDRDLAVLQFESRRYRQAGARVAAMREELDMTPTVYAQTLNRLLDDPDAERVAPQLIHRLRRLRDKRVGERIPRAS